MLQSNSIEKRPYLIAGPCSAESRQQVLTCAKLLADSGKIDAFRAGIWKPRTRPGQFEGMDTKGLKWLSEVKERFGLPTITEVATSKHVEQILNAGIDMVWIGARTTSNPFSVNEIALALKGVDIPVFVKNPINPDLQLWIGAIERLINVGIKQITAIHRGFFPYEPTSLRNIPKWEIAIELKTYMPELPIFCDPSHIAGIVGKIPEIAQYALDIMMDGLMVEVHPNPSKAKTDVLQQLSPVEYIKMIDNLNFRHQSTDITHSKIDKWRLQIDSIDLQILELLGKRFAISEQIAIEKKALSFAPFQLERWRKIIKTRLEYANKIGLNENFVNTILQIIHRESINIQNQLMSSNGKEREGKHKKN